MLTTDELRAWLAEGLGLDLSRLGNDSPLFSDGTFDSFTMVELVALIEEKTGKDVPAVQVSFENIDTINRLLAWIQAHVGGV